MILIPLRYLLRWLLHHLAMIHVPPERFSTVHKASGAITHKEYLSKVRATHDPSCKRVEQPRVVGLSSSLVGRRAPFEGPCICGYGAHRTSRLNEARDCWLCVFSKVRSLKSKVEVEFRSSRELRGDGGKPKPNQNQAKAKSGPTRDSAKGRPRQKYCPTRRSQVAQLLKRFQTQRFIRNQRNRDKRKEKNVFRRYKAGEK